MIRELRIARLSVVAEIPRTRAASHLPGILTNLAPNLAQGLFCEATGVWPCVLKNLDARGLIDLYDRVQPRRDEDAMFTTWLIDDDPDYIEG